MALYKQILNLYKTGDKTIRFIFINVAVWVPIFLISLVFVLFKKNDEVFHTFITNWFAVPANLLTLATHPWTLFTYMFLHIDLTHILFNMLWLFWFGRIFLMYLSAKQFVTTYILGGLAGAIVYIVCYNLFPAFEDAENARCLGASASVMAIVIATAVYLPEFTVNLMFIGSVRLKFIALFCIISDIIMIKYLKNPGGHLAHLGGALYGYLFILQLKKDRDFSVTFYKVWGWIKQHTGQGTKLRVEHNTKPRFTDYEYNAQIRENQKRVDLILDKISKSGYEALTAEEKQFLFKHSSKN